MVVVMAAAAIAAPEVAAAAEEQNEDNDEPQAGAVVVTIVEPHDCHLTLLRHSMRREPEWSLANRKIPGEPGKNRVSSSESAKRNGGFHG